jgi:hypothetical protein
LGNRRIWRRLIMAGCLAVGGVLGASAAKVDFFAVESASLRLVGDVYRLSAVMDIHLPPHVVKAIENGLPITLATIVEVQRPRWYWLDATVTRVERRHQLSYHALSQQYLVRDLKTGRQTGYLALQEAIADLSVILDYPILDADALDSSRDYEVRLRVQLDRVALPAVLRTEDLLDSRWNLASDWFEWDLAL